MQMKKLRKWCSMPVFCLMACALHADQIAVRHPCGYIHGFLVVKDMDNKIVGSGDIVQRPAGSRVTSVMTLHFTDGSLYEETSVFSQRRTFQLLTYKLVQKGPSFKTPKTFSFDTASGNVRIDYIDKKDNGKSIADHIDLPPDLANGIVPLLLTNTDPKTETTLSMVVSTPKPRVVKLKIMGAAQDPFSIMRRSRQGHALRYQNRYRRGHGRRGESRRETTAPAARLGGRGERTGLPAIGRGVRRGWPYMARRTDKSGLGARCSEATHPALKPTHLVRQVNTSSGA